MNRDRSSDIDAKRSGSEHARRNRRWLHASIAALLCLVLCVIAMPLFTGNGPEPGPAPKQDSIIPAQSPEADAEALLLGEGEGEASELSDDAGTVDGSGSLTITVPGGEITVASDAFVDYGGTSYQDGQLLVKPKPGASAADISSALAEQGLPGVQVLEEAEGYSMLSVPEGLDVSEMAAILRVQDLVDNVQPNFIYQVMGDGAGVALSSSGSADGSLQVLSLGTSATPSDPLLGQQWGLSSMKVPAAWDVSKASGKVAIAVIDQAFYVNHDDLKGNIKGTYDATDGGTDVYSQGNMWHGTHVAGTLGAVADNGIGIAGVSWNADLVLIKVYDDGEGNMSTQSVVEAYNYIARYNQSHPTKIRIANMSLGTLATPGVIDTMVYEKIDEAFESGIVTVCAAGNSATAPVPYSNFPADHDAVVSVINLEKRYDASGTWVGETRNQTSNYNVAGKRTKDISAPGTNIISLLDNSGGYIARDGTSMAAPSVAGVFALVLAKSSALSAQEAVDVVYNSAKDLGSAGFDPYYGHGEVNAQAAVKNTNGYLSGNTAVNAGSTIKLTPALSTGSGWTWTSSNNSIATVSGGTVTGVKAGMATITAKSGNTTLSRTIAVYPNTLTGASKVAIGSTITLKAATPPTGTWKFTSSNTSVATVSSAGVVKGVAEGKATITATHAYHSNVKVTKVVSVPKKWSASGATRMPVSSTAAWTCTNCTIKAASGQSVLSVSGSTVTAKAAGSAKVEIYDSTGTIAATRTVTVYALSGTYQVKSASNTEFGLSIAGASTAKGANVQLAAAQKVKSQQFRFIRQNDGSYLMQNVLSGMDVTITGFSKDNGTNIRQWPKNDKSNERWKLRVDASNRITFVNAYSGKALDISGAKAKASANILQWSVKSTESLSLSQKWMLVS